MDFPKNIAGRFNIKDQLVRRPSCVVYSATDSTLGDREVAVKFFIDRPNDKQEWIDSFNVELELLKNSSHKVLIPILDGGYADGWLYLVMELIQGPTLRDYMKDVGGPLELEKALDILRELSDGVSEIHERQAFHGHIDSRAILFKGDPNNPRVQVRLAGYYPQVIDQIQKSMTSDGRLIVDPVYIAPEQISGQTKDQRVDVYALSVLLFEMLTGQKPFTSSNPLQTAMMRLSQEPPSPAKLNPKLSPLVDAAILKGLAKNSADRFNSTAELVDAVSGGKSIPKNPLAQELSPDRISGTETIAVSMSTDAIKQLLRVHDGQRSLPNASSKTDSKSEDAQSADSIDTQQTMIGIPTASLLPATLMVMNGEKRGEKFIIDKNQLMIGGDAGCDIWLSGKNVAARYAIIVRRDGNYYLAQLSREPLIVNDKKVESEDDILLKRGDIINVGNHRLRYIAPGEVFTLHDNVADRTIDRPASRMNLIIAATCVALVVFGGGLIYNYRSNLSSKQSQLKRAKLTQQQKREEAVAVLLKEGDEFFKAGALKEPIGVNAFERFQKVLELDSDNSFAKRRLVEIEARVTELGALAQRRKQYEQKIIQLIRDADGYFRSGQYVSPPGRNAKEVYQEVLRLDPEHQHAKAQVAEIDNLLGDMVGQVNNLLAKAQEYIDRNQYVVPRGESAYEELQKVLQIDPNNEKAKNTLIDLAAVSIFSGDRAKRGADHATMRRSYLTAQALGVDPAYIQPRLKGAELIKKSKSEVIIFDHGDKDSKNTKSENDSRYLDTAEIERRVSELALREKTEGEASTRVFINLSDSLTP